MTSASGRGSSLVGQFRTLFEAGTVSGLTDGQLLERFLDRRDDGGEAAFAALVARHGPMVLGVCRRALGDPNDVADAFQATFLILVRKARTVRVGDSLGRWLYGVSRKVASRARVHAARRSKGDRGEVQNLAARSVDPDLFELSAVLDEELARLPAAFRTALVLCDLGGLTHEEAARDLVCPVGTIKSRLARGRKRLRERLERRGVAPVGFGLGLGLAPMVPGTLAEAAVRASMVSAIHGVSAVGVVSTSAMALAEGVLRTMTLFQWKLAASAVLSVTLVASGAGVLAQARKGDDDKPSTGFSIARIEDAKAPEGRHVVEVQGDRLLLDGRDTSPEELARTLALLVKVQAQPSRVLIRVATDAKYRDVTRVAEVAKAAGIADIQLAPVEPRMDAKLNEPIKLHVNDKALGEVTQVLGQLTGVNFVIDAKMLAEAGLSAESKVSLTADGIKLKDFLKYLLRPLGLTYKVEDDVILITTPQPTLDSKLADAARKQAATIPAEVEVRLQNLEAKLDLVLKALERLPKP